MDDPNPAEQNITEAGKAANKAAWERFQRVNLVEIDMRMQGCKHTYAKSGSIFVCQKCGQPAPIEEAEIEYW